MLSVENLQRYLRVMLQWAFTALATHGVTIGDSYKQAILGVGGMLLTFAWTVYGNRLNALLAEIVKAPEVAKVVADPAVAAAVPSDKVVPGNA